MQDRDKLRAPDHKTCVTGVKLVKYSTSDEQNPVLDRILSQQGKYFRSNGQPCLNKWKMKALAFWMAV